MDLFKPTTGEALSVTAVVERARSLLEGEFPLLRVSGEIAGWKVAASGHAYFTLKDSQSQLPVVMFRGSLSRLPELPHEGMAVECLGRLTVYTARGQMQLLAQWLSPSGSGELALQFARLKERLAAEGLFDPERKRPLPRFPSAIGLVTSPAGAALHDVLTVLGRRWPLAPVVLASAPVQGEGAGHELAEALLRLARSGYCQVIILTRGGGSAEDLWAFNDEQLVRAVAACPVPVVSAVGHEVDMVLTDLAADVRAPTPSAAAELVVPDGAELRRRLEALAQSATRSLRWQLAAGRERWQRLAASLRDPRLLLANRRRQLDDGQHRLERLLAERLQQRRQALESWQGRLLASSPAAELVRWRTWLRQSRHGLGLAARRSLEKRRQRLQASRRLLAGLDPRAVLARGFSQVVNDSGQVVRSAGQLRPGDRFRVFLHRGGISGRVERLEEEPGRTSGESPGRSR